MGTLNTRPDPVAFTRRVTAALAAGIAVALVTHLATVVVYYVVNGASGENLAPINAYFVPASLVLFVLASVATSLGAHRWVTAAAIVGVVAGAIAFWLGAGWGYVQAGGQWGADAGAYAASALIGPGIFFVVASAFVMVLVGARVWNAVLRVTAPTRRTRVLVRTPSPRLAEGELTHLERTPVDLALADEQWQDYVEALEAEGFETVEVPAAADHPDSVFVEDAVVVFGETAVITRPGAESRAGETEAVHATVAELGYTVRTIEAPGTLEGGDVLKVGTTVYVGRSSRTNAEGCVSFARSSRPSGMRSLPCPSRRRCTSSRRSARCPTAPWSEMRRSWMPRRRSPDSSRCPSPAPSCSCSPRMPCSCRPRHPSRRHSSPTSGIASSRSTSANSRSSRAA